MNLTFRTGSTATSLRAQVRAKVFGAFWVPFPLDASKSNVCKHLSNAECPLAKNTEATFNFAIMIPFIAPPGIELTVEYRIVDQNHATVACTRIPVQVK